MYLYFIRHGQSHVNLANWKHGNIDAGLTSQGKSQATALARFLPERLPQVDAVYASTMQRAKETAQALAVAYQHEPIFDDRLREIGNNRLDHTAWPNDALPNNYVDFWGSERPFVPIVTDVEFGETLMHFRMRAGLFIEEMVERHYQQREDSVDEQVVLAVCHGGVIDAAFNHIFNIGHRQHCETRTHNTGVTCFRYAAHPNREPWQLLFHDRTDHLTSGQLTR